MNILYTANYGNYDNLIPITIQKPDNWSAYYFTDCTEFPKGWIKRTYSAPNWWKELPNPAKAKCIKIYPWLVLGNQWDWCIWVDSNMSISNQTFKIIDKHKEDFMVFPQKGLDKLYTEVDRITRHPRKYLKDLKDHIKEREKYYKSIEIPDNDITGGIGTGIIIRKNTKQVRHFCIDVMKQFLEDAYWRDQVSFRIVAHQKNFHIHKIPRKDMGVKGNHKHGGNK